MAARLGVALSDALFDYVRHAGFGNLVERIGTATTNNPLGVGYITVVVIIITLVCFTSVIDVQVLGIRK